MWNIHVFLRYSGDKSYYWLHIVVVVRVKAVADIALGTKLRANQIRFHVPEFVREESLEVCNRDSPGNIILSSGFWFASFTQAAAVLILADNALVMGTPRAPVRQSNCSERTNVCGN